MDNPADEQGPTGLLSKTYLPGTYLLTAMAKLVPKIRAFKIKYICIYFLLVFVGKDCKTSEKQNCWII